MSLHLLVIACDAYYILVQGLFNNKLFFSLLHLRRGFLHWEEILGFLFVLCCFLIFIEI